MDREPVEPSERLVRGAGKQVTQTGCDAAVDDDGCAALASGRVEPLQVIGREADVNDRDPGLHGMMESQAAEIAGQGRHRCISTVEQVGYARRAGGIATSPLDLGPELGKRMDVAHDDLVDVRAGCEILGDEAALRSASEHDDSYGEVLRRRVV